MCGLYVEELTRESTMIEQWLILYQLKTNARLINMVASDAFSRGHSLRWKEPATGPLGVNISVSRFKLHFQKFGNVIWGFFPREFLSFIEINFDFH